MNKLNRIIGGSAIAIALMAMGAPMPTKAMEKLNCTSMPQVRIMKHDMENIGITKVMKLMSQKVG